MASERLDAIILAAGMSRRMGRTKVLLDFCGKPLLARIVEAFREASIEQITVVTGHQPDKIESALGEFRVNFVQNDQYETGGMISSVKIGIGAAADQCGAFFLALGDHAPVKPGTLQSIAHAWNEPRARIVLPKYHGKHGHPILVSSSLAPEILALSSGETLATIVARRENAPRDVAVDDPAIVENIDTPDDYNRALDRWTRREELGNRSTSDA